jgi:hypothetical protein
MNKRQIIASLNKIANELDGNGLYSEANEVTEVMMKLSQTGISSTFGVTPPDSGMFGSEIGSGNIPSGIDKSALPSKPTYKGLGPKNPSDPQVAQKWINTNSALVDGDMKKLYNLALKNKQMAKDPQQAKKFNDILYILQNHPDFKDLSNKRGLEL